jgi:hypothetical protein
MLAGLEPPGSARVLACNFPASRRKSLFGETLRQLPDGTRMLPNLPKPWR